MGKLLCSDGSVRDVYPLDGREFTLRELRGFVGGWIECLRLDGGRWMVVDEDGKLKGYVLNCLATDIYRDYYGGCDFIVGDALICEDGEIS